MLECLCFKSLTTSSSTSPSLPNLPVPSQSQGNSSTQQGTPNVSREYNLAVHANSYNEIRSMIQGRSQDQVHLVYGYSEDDDSNQNLHQQLLARVLHPGRECVQEALRKAKPTTLTRLVSTYFHHSETTSRLCLLVHRSVRRARAMYAPLRDLLCVLPTDSNSVPLTQSLCDRAIYVFLQFDGQDNPFASHDYSDNFSDIRSCFSELKQQLDARLRKSRSRIRLIRRATAGSALCFVVAAVGLATAAVVVTIHAIVALAAAPACSACIIPHPKNTEKKELARLKQLDAAAKGAYVLNNDLGTIDRLVARLHTAVEGDKLLIRLGLERASDRYPIQEVLKQLHKNHQNFLHQLEDLEEHIYLCFNTVNKARSLLLQEICLHRTL